MTQLDAFPKDGICVTCSKATTGSTWTVQDVLVAKALTCCSESCCEKWAEARISKLREDIKSVHKMMLDSIKEEEHATRPTESENRMP